MKTYSIWLGDDDAERLESLAARLGRTPEDVAAMLVTTGLVAISERGVSDAEIDGIVEEYQELYRRLAE